MSRLPAYTLKILACSIRLLKLPRIIRRSAGPAPVLQSAYVCAGLFLTAFSAHANTLDRLGWLEWAWLQPQNVMLKTKLDTGAKTSAIDATDIEKFERDGKPWVRFTIPLSKRPEDSDIEGDLTLEKPLVKTIKIKDHDRAPTERYVVRLGLCIGGKMFDTPVSLSNRRQFNYPFLLGRMALKKRIVVDSSVTFTTGKSCTSGN